MDLSLRPLSYWVRRRDRLKIKISSKKTRFIFFVYTSGSNFIKLLKEDPQDFHNFWILLKSSSETRLKRTRLLTNTQL